VSPSSASQTTLSHLDELDALWDLLANPEIDPSTLVRAIETVLDQPGLDWRTLQLVKEGWQALEHFGRETLLNTYLVRRSASEIRELIRARTSTPGDGHREIKFPSLRDRLMPHLSPATIRQFLRELGTAISQPVTMTIGGAGSLILRGLLSRATEDVDVVDEIPVAIREERPILDELARRYGLHLTHYQSRYLPGVWESRTSDLGSFGEIHVRLIDPYDIIAGKIFSNRPKDRDDFRLLSLALDREELKRRIVGGLSPLWSNVEQRDVAIRNWYIVYGEELSFDAA
jgi:hypothetical protein